MISSRNVKGNEFEKMNDYGIVLESSFYLEQLW